MIDHGLQARRYDEGMSGEAEMEPAFCTGAAFGVNEDGRKAQIQARIKLKDLLLHGGDVLDYVVRCCVVERLVHRGAAVVIRTIYGSEPEGRQHGRTGAAFM